MRHFLRWIRDDGGQVLPLVVAAAVVLIGFAGIVIDLGRVWVARQQLQQSVDSAALAAGQYLPDASTAYNTALSYSAYGTNGQDSKNPMTGWGVKANKASVTFECVSHGPNYTAAPTGNTAPTCLTDSSGANCQPSGANPPTPTGLLEKTCNAVNVTETATVSTGLLKLFLGNFTVSASSTSGARGSGVPKPMNIIVILDTTGSMQDQCTGGTVPITSTTDIHNPTKLDCAKQGVRALLQAMPYSTINGSTVADDYVGLDVFPAMSSVLSAGSPVTTSGTVTLTGTATKNSTTLSNVTTSSSIPLAACTGTTAPCGDTITGYTPTNPTPALPGGTTTITKVAASGPTWKVTLSQALKVNGTVTVSYYGLTGTTTPYVLATPPTASLNHEIDCSSGSNLFGVTYPPWGSYSYTSGGTGGIPATDIYSYGTNTAYGPSPGYIDNYQGYQAVPLSGDYQTDGAGTLNTSSNLVRSVYWYQCTNHTYPGGDYYGVKDISGQGSYLAGAITAAEYQLHAPGVRTVGPDGTSPVTDGIIILSDGDLGAPDSGKDGVDPGANGNYGYTSGTPCQDAINAAAAAKAAGTLIFSIAYDGAGENCDDGSGTNHFNGSAATLMQDLASGTQYFANQQNAGDLTQQFQQAAEELTGDSRLIPDCTQAPPAC